MSKAVLVSGANGFIAAHAVEKLLAQGYAVTGTVRKPDDPKLSFLKSMQGSGSLKLVAADLTAPDPFSAHADVDAILHMASPYVMNVQDAQRDLVDPAVNGTLSMLAAAARFKRVKRVVLTSSMAAITDEPDGRLLTEKDWNSQSSLTRNPYYFSKTMAERAAWDFMQREKPSFDLVVINPFLVIGPAHTSAVNTSNQIFVDLLKGKYPALMALDWGFVDVRDVADAHVRALTLAAANGRYICAAENRNMVQVVKLMKQAGYKGRLPRFDASGGFGTQVMKLVSYTQGQGVGSYLRTHLRRSPRFDNSKIRNELGLAFRPIEQTILETLGDLARWGHISA